MVAGILCGITFGEYCGYLRVVGEAYIGLLQMTVLPFIAVSLITNLGKLNARVARRVAWSALLAALLLWAVGLIGIPILTLIFPPMESASFFSASMLSAPPELNIVSLFIPANFFHSLASGLVPAIVVFCVCIGIALMHLPHRDRLLQPLEVINQALLRVNSYVVRTTPVGVFALVADSSGSLKLSQIERLQAYVLAYLVGVSIYTLWILPMIVSLLTPFTYREVLRLSKESLLTAFATGKTITVIPLLIDQTDQFLHEHGYDLESENPDARTLYPLIYSLPNLGSLLTLVFIPFAAWYIGEPLLSRQYPLLLSTGLLTYFGKPIIAIPFLLDLMRLPVDTFELFVVSGVYLSRFGDLLSVMTLVAFTLITAASLQGWFQLNTSRLPRFLAVTAVLACIGIVVPHQYLKRALHHSNDKKRVLEQMQVLVNDRGYLLLENPPVMPAEDVNERVLDRLNRTSRLRVGYLPDNLPYTFLNQHGHLVGLDIDMALLLSQELQCEITFVPVTNENMVSLLNTGRIDVVMSGVPITTNGLRTMRFSAAYLDVSWALMVEDHNRHDFTSLERIQELDRFRIAVPRGDYFRRKMEVVFPQASFVEVESVRELLNSNTQADAILVEAEGGAAWTLIYPSYHVVVPSGTDIKQPLGYAVSLKQGEFASFLSRWIDLKKKSGEFDRIYRHWILGEGATPPLKPWSIIRNVLGWVD